MSPGRSSVAGAAATTASLVILAACTGVPFGPPLPTAGTPSPPASASTAASPTTTVPETTATATPGPNEWQALIFDRPRSPASIHGIVARGPVLVAVGTADGDGAVWTFERDGEWERSTDTPASEEDEVVILLDVAAGPRGLVAVGVGGAPQSEPAFSVMWSSADGIRWRESERVDGVLLETVAYTGAAMIAAGGLGPAVGSPHGVAMWSSADGGSTWTEVEGTEALGTATMTGILSTEQGLVAVGHARNDPAAFEVSAAVWTSPDGTTWTRLPHAAPFEASGMRAVTIGSGAYVAVGSDHSAGRTRPAVWSSGNATEWQRSRLEGEEGAMDGVAPADDEFAAVGYVQSGAETRLALWTSEDGVSWTLEPAVSEEGTGVLHDVVAFFGRLIAVGEVTDPETGESHPVVFSGPLP